MVNNYYFLNAASVLAMDVSGGSTPGTPLAVEPPNSPVPSPNQLWTFEAGPSSSPGSYFIRSNLGHNLVVDVKGGSTTSGTPLQVSPQNSSASQLWKWEHLGLVPITPWGWVQSQLGRNLVVDLEGEKTEQGTLLDVSPQGSGGTQLWYLIPGPGNTYNPQITSIVEAPAGFIISGTGFQAGTPLVATYRFADAVTGNGQQGHFATWADFGGNFSDESQVSGLVGTSNGTLYVQIFISSPPLATVTAKWDGSTFTIVP
jgi:hypothetical protein